LMRDMSFTHLEGAAIKTSKTPELTTNAHKKSRGTVYENFEKSTTVLLTSLRDNLVHEDKRVRATRAPDTEGYLDSKT